MDDLIDHKDKPGECRDRVRDEVLSQFTVEASVVTSRQDIVGSWQWRASIPPVGEVVMHYRFLPSGQFASTISTQPSHVSSEKNRWELNPDGTLSLFHWFDAEHSTVRGRAGYEETRYFLRALADGRRVLWNGDGSLVLALERVD